MLNSETAASIDPNPKKAGCGASRQILSTIFSLFDHLKLAMNQTRIAGDLLFILDFCCLVGKVLVHSALMSCRLKTVTEKMVNKSKVDTLCQQGLGMREIKDNQVKTNLK